MAFNPTVLKNFFHKISRSGMADDVAKAVTKSGAPASTPSTGTTLQQLFKNSNPASAGKLYGEDLLTPSRAAFMDAIDGTPKFKASGVGFDNKPLGLIDIPDDIPPVEYLRPHNVGLADDALADATTHLGKHYAEPVLGMKSFQEINPDPSATIRVPEIPLDSLVFAQHVTDPSVISVRPHKNTALGRWFQNQTQNLDTPNSFDFWGDSLNSDKFVETFNKKRLAEREMHNRLNSSPQFNDEDLPF